MILVPQRTKPDLKPQTHLEDKTEIVSTKESAKVVVFKRLAA